MDEGYRISLGFDTTNALRDAHNLGNDVRRILKGIDNNALNSKSLTFVKNLTSACNKMEDLAVAAERLGRVPVPTKEYKDLQEEVTLTEKKLAQLKARQIDMQSHGETTGPKWGHLVDDIEVYTDALKQLRKEMQLLDANGMAFMEGTDTQAYKDSLKALHDQNQAVNIVIEKFKEYAEAHGLILNTKREDTEATNKETDATNKETEATKNLQKAEEDLAKSRQRNNVSRGPVINEERHGIRRGPAKHYDLSWSSQTARGPAFSEATFLKNGQDIRQLSQEEEHLDNSVKKTNEDIKQQNNTVQNSSRSFNSANKAARSFASTLLNSLGNAIRRVVHGLGNISRHLHSSHRSSDGLGKSMKHTFMTVMRFTLGIRSIFMLVRRIRGYIKEAFKVMAQEIPEVNRDISRLGQSFKELKAGFGTMLQPVLKMLTPILDTLLQKVISLMNAIGKFFATLAGQDYVYQATVANYDYAESVKAAEGSLASFDKLNVISKSKNDLSLDKDTVKYEKVKIEPDENWYTKLAQAIKEGWEKGDLSGATNALAEKLAGWLDGIKWDDIKAKSKKFVSTLASGINGLTLPDPETGKSDLAVSIGNTIANAIDWAIENLYEWANDIHWSNLGKFFADAIDALKTKLREEDTWKDAGMAIGRLFQGIVEFGLELFVKGNVFEGLGTDLATMLDEALEKGLEINPETGNTFMKDFGIMISNAITKLLDEIIDFLDKTEREGKLGKAVNELFQGIDLVEIAKRLVIAFLKGFKLGLELLVQAGLGALGIELDTSTVETLAEALGLGIMFTKIKDLIKAITGSSSLFGGSGSGGLLGAFKKKDNALDNQTKKVGAESGALGGLITKIGGVVTSLLLFLIPGLSSTSDEIADLSTQTETYTKTAEQSNEALKQSYDNTLTALQTDITAMETALNEAKLKTPDVDTTSLVTMLETARTDSTTLQNLINNMTLNVPSIGTAALDSLLNKIKQTVADAQAEMDKIFGTNYSKTSPKATPLYELTQESIKATQESQKQNNKGYVEHSNAADEAAGKGAEYQKWLNEQNGISVQNGTPLYELTQESIKATQEYQKTVSDLLSDEESLRMQNANTSLNGLVPPKGQTITAPPSAGTPMLSGSKDAIGAMYDAFYGSSTGLSKKVFTELMEKKFNSLTSDEFATLVMLQMAATSGTAIEGADKSGMVDYWKNLLGYTKADVNAKYQGRDKIDTFLNQLFGITDETTKSEKTLKLISGLASVMVAAGTMSTSVASKFGSASGGADIFDLVEYLKKVSGLANGAVLPPNQPFLAMVGDQKSGTNIEAPLSTIEQAVANVMSKMGLEVILKVESDTDRIFKAMQKKARIYYKQTDRNAFT